MLNRDIFALCAMFIRTGYDVKAAATVGGSAIWSTGPGNSREKCVVINAGDLNNWEHDVIPAMTVLVEQTLAGVDVCVKNKLDEDAMLKHVITAGCQELRRRYPDESVVRWITPLDPFTGATCYGSKIRVVRLDKVAELFSIYRSLM